MGPRRRYTIHGKIASGGMASVHFGRLLGAEGFARTVAIKRLHPHLAEDPSFRATLIDEARMAARIHHPNVVPTLDVVSEEGELLVVMEYVRGESLSRLLQLEGEWCHIPLPLVSAIAVGALYGLHAAHEAKSDRGVPLGIVHRDVSPQNILVGADGMARVIDFGVAKAAGRLQVTLAGTIKGKRAYMAPEQISGGVLTPSADVYAIGVVLWEMLAAKRLFPGEQNELASSVLAGAQEPPSRYAPDVSPELDALVMKALALTPADRFASAQEMAELLTRLVPPALSVDLARWVEQSARQALSERGARLAEIESASGAATALTSPPEDGAGETITALLGSQTSSLSLETPSPGPPRNRRSQRRGWWLGGAAALGLLTVGLLVSLRGHRAALPALSGPVPPSGALATAAPVLPPMGGTSDASEPSGSPSPQASAALSPPAGPRRGVSAAPLRPSRSAPLPPPRSSSAQSPPPSSPTPTPSCTVVTNYDHEGQPHFKKVCR